jgi:hypothetical protein
MSRWNQKLEPFPLRSLLAGYLYARWLRLRRRLGYLCGSSRAWQESVVLPGRAHVVE